MPSQSGRLRASLTFPSSTRPGVPTPTPASSVASSSARRRSRRAVAAASSRRHVRRAAARRRRAGEPSRARCGRRRSRQPGSSCRRDRSHRRWTSRADHGRGAPTPPEGASAGRQGCCGSGIAELLGLTLTVGAGSAAMRVISWSHWAGLSSPPTISGETAPLAAAAQSARRARRPPARAPRSSSSGGRRRGCGSRTAAWRACSRRPGSASGSRSASGRNSLGRLSSVRIVEVGDGTRTLMAGDRGAVDGGDVERVHRLRARRRRGRRGRGQRCSAGR